MTKTETNNCRFAKLDWAYLFKWTALDKMSKPKSSLLLNISLVQRIRFQSNDVIRNTNISQISPKVKSDKKEKELKNTGLPACKRHVNNCLKSMRRRRGVHISHDARVHAESWKDIASLIILQFLSRNNIISLTSKRLRLHELKEVNCFEHSLYRHFVLLHCRYALHSNWTRFCKCFECTCCMYLWILLDEFESDKC